ncbi:unnamed protein product [Musa banksii]
MAIAAEIGSAAVGIPQESAGLVSSRHVGQGFVRTGWGFRPAHQQSVAVRSIGITERSVRALQSEVSNSRHLNSGPEVRSGDVAQPILLKEGQVFNLTIKRGVSSDDTVIVNYDDFVNDVEVGDILLVDGGMMSLAVRSKTADTVKCKVIDGGELKSRRHLNVRGKSATLPSITEKDWEDIKFGVDNQVDFYAVSFVKDAKVNT